MERKMYTDDMTINEVLESLKRDERLIRYFNIIYWTHQLEVIPKEAFEMPLKEVRTKIVLPWGQPFPVDELLELSELCEREIINPKYKIIPLWKEQNEDFVPQVHPSNKESVILLTNAKKGGNNMPAAIICPGGGYEHYATYGEGMQMASVLEEAGYQTFILLYRVSPNMYPAPQMDLAFAIKYVRANAKEYGIDPDNVLIVGSSAGGHLCASLPIVYDEVDKMLMDEMEKDGVKDYKKYEGISPCPNKVCLNYPVISLFKEQHEGSAAALAGDDKELREKLSVDLHVSPQYPKTFVWACEDDDLVPVSNTIRLGEALKINKVEHITEIHPTGNHGCGLAYGTSAEGWIDRMIKFMK